MRSNRHKRKNSHVLILTSDSVEADAEVKQYKIKPWILRLVILVLCVIIGAMIGYLIYEKDIWAEELRQTALRQDEITALEQEKLSLQGEIADLNDKISGLNGEIEELNGQIKILSGAVSQKTQTVEELQGELEKLTLPVEFPLTGAATMEEKTEGEPICIFTAAEGSMVVATAKGTVIVVNDDPEYGHNVWIDHGNGYVTVYRNQGNVMVNQGETVMPGATLFFVEKNNSRLGYQMLKDGAYINPMEMLSISG